MLNIIAPAGKTYLPFQFEGIKWATSRRHSLLAYDMGMGKTIMAIGAINTLKARKVLVTCPASVKIQWERKLNEWLVEFLSVYRVTKKTDKIPDADVIIVNYDLIVHSHIFYQLQSRKFAVGIFDEVHKVKNFEAKRTKALLSRNGLARNCVYTISMTGTPVVNRPIELYPLLKVFARDSIKPYDDKYKFAFRFCDGWINNLQLDARGSSNEDDLNKRLKAKYMIRRLEADVIGQLPPVRYKMVLVEKDDMGAELKILESATKKDFGWTASGMSGGDLAKERKIFALKKVTACEEHIKEIVEQAGKLVIFAYHTEVILKLQTMLSEYGAVVLYGATSQTKRQQAIDSFQKSSLIRVFIGQIEASGEGIDGLQYAAHHILFAEWSWVPGQIKQAIKRVHRFGQLQTVYIQFLVAADTIEEHIMRTALEKVETINKIIN